MHSLSSPSAAPELPRRRNTSMHCPERIALPDDDPSRGVGAGPEVLAGAAARGGGACGRDLHDAAAVAALHVGGV